MVCWAKHLLLVFANILRVELALTHRKPSIVAAKIFLGVLLLLLAWAPALTWWGDGKEACQAAHTLVESGKALTSDPQGQVMASIRPLLFTLSCLPTATLLPLPDPDESPVVRLARALPPAIFGAGCAAIFFLILLQMFVPERFAAALSIALVFSTPLWIYSRIHYSEGLQTFINLCLFYFLMRSKQNTRNCAIIIGFLVGMLINLRTTNVIILPFVLAFQVINDDLPWSRRIRSWAWTLAGLVPWVFAWLGFNHLRFGSYWITGYEASSVWRNPLTGLFGQLFSPGKSIFLFAPLTIAGALFFIRRLARLQGARRLEKTEYLVACFFLSNLILYSSWWAWGGGWAWGPRFLIPFMPLMLLPLAEYVATAKPTRTLYASIAGLTTIGFVVQLPVTIVGIHQLLQFLGLIDRAAFGTQPVYGTTSEEMIFSTFIPEFSPIFMQIKLLAAMILNPEHASIDFSHWTGDQGPYRVPGFSGRVVEFDALQPDLWFWTTGQNPNSWLFLAGALALAVTGAAILASVFRPESGKVQSSP